MKGVGEAVTKVQRITRTQQSAIDASRTMISVIRATDASDDRKALHSFRGTLKYMLRHAGVTKGLNDFFTGHGSGDVAGDYDEGHSLEKRYEAINKVDISFLSQLAYSP